MSFVHRNARPMRACHRELNPRRRPLHVSINLDDELSRCTCGDLGHQLRPKPRARSLRLRKHLRTIAGALLRLTYGARFTDMSPFRAIQAGRLRGLGMSETTYGWNLEMQMRAAATGLRILEVPVDHRCRRGGVSKVSGDLFTGMHAAWKIATTFVRLSVALRRA